MKKDWSNDPDFLILFDGAQSKAGLPLVNDMVIHNANVHLECQDDTSFMLIVDNDIHYWHLVIFSRSGRAKVEAHVYESAESGAE